MWSYDNGPSRRGRDVPPSSSRRYYGSVYDQPYDDAAPAAAPKSHERHRRKSVGNLDDDRHGRRATVVPSDDGYARGSSRDAYGGASRHDAEAKTSDRNRQFRDKRGTYEADEAQNLRRAKSYSPKRAARDAEAPRYATSQAPPKSSWPQEDYAAEPRRSKPKKSRAPQQYYEEDPYAAYGKTSSRTKGGYNYETSPSGMPPPPMGDYKPYKSSPIPSSKATEEKPSKHSRGREPTYYAGGYEDYAEPEAPRHRRRRHTEAAPAYEDDAYPPRSSAKERIPPQNTYEDPYDRSTRSRHRSSVPPRRSRYDDAHDDPYAAPRRRATSASYGYGGYDTRDPRYEDERFAPMRNNSNSSGSSGQSPGVGPGGAKKEKGKKIGKQAGKLFMTHAFPVIKQEAVPFLTKAAQAYFEQNKR